MKDRRKKKRARKEKRFRKLRHDNPPKWVAENERLELEILKTIVENDKESGP